MSSGIGNIASLISPVNVNGGIYTQKLGKILNQLQHVLDQDGEQIHEHLYTFSFTIFENLDFAIPFHSLLGAAHRVTYFFLVLSDFHNSFAHSARYFIAIL
jgi:hypothetical protein